jgi:hypothetical protein
LCGVGRGRKQYRDAVRHGRHPSSSRSTPILGREQRLGRVRPVKPGGCVGSPMRFAMRSGAYLTPCAVGRQRVNPGSPFHLQSITLTHRFCGGSATS